MRGCAPDAEDQCVKPFDGSGNRRRSFRIFSARLAGTGGSRVCAVAHLRSDARNATADSYVSVWVNRGKGDMVELSTPRKRGR